jgi:hypothetical protein
MSKLTKFLVIIDGILTVIFILLSVAAYNAPFDTGNPDGLWLPGIILVSFLILTSVLLVIDLRHQK